MSCNTHPGAGIYARQQTLSSEFEPHPIANNGLIVSASDGLILDCVSNTSQSGVGMITGLDGNTLPIGNTGVWRVVYPFSHPGVLRLQTISSSSISAANQGIYTLALFLTVMTITSLLMLDCIPLDSWARYSYISTQFSMCPICSC